MRDLKDSRPVLVVLAAVLAVDRAVILGPVLVVVLAVLLAFVAPRQRRRPAIVPPTSLVARKYL